MTILPSSGGIVHRLSLPGMPDILSAGDGRVYMRWMAFDDDGVVVIPRQALVLDAIGDVVFVVEDGWALRRRIEVGLVGVGHAETVVDVTPDSITVGIVLRVVQQHVHQPDIRLGLGAHRNQHLDLDLVDV